MPSRPEGSLRRSFKGITSSPPRLPRTILRALVGNCPANLGWRWRVRQGRMCCRRVCCVVTTSTTWFRCGSVDLRSHGFRADLRIRAETTNGCSSSVTTGRNCFVWPLGCARHPSHALKRPTHVPNKIAVLRTCLCLLVLVVWRTCASSTPGHRHGDCRQRRIRARPGGIAALHRGRNGHDGCQ